MKSRAVQWVGRAFRKAGNEILRRSGVQRTWIDVGAHRGDESLGYAKYDPTLRIFAIEPDLSAAVKLVGAAPNYFVLPVAIAETDGCADFHLNDFAAASSLLPLNLKDLTPEDARQLRVNQVRKVPTLRLDTLMNIADIDTVEFLKIDAQGMDLSVLKSAGDRLKDIAKITLEVWTAPHPQYVGVPSKEEVVKYLQDRGFVLTGTQVQTEGREENLTFARAGRSHKNR
jgi:FkbM family methyltransferase